MSLNFPSQPAIDLDKPVWYLVTRRDGVPEVLQLTMREGELSWKSGVWSSMCHRDTKEQLYADQGILEGCVECGGTFGTTYCEPCRTQLITGHICFHCQFWRERLAEKDEPGTVRAEGQHYQFDTKQPMTSSGRWNGFGGREFDIRFHDGRQFKTNNLWSQGVIPARFRERLPDNATFHWPAPIGHKQGFLS